MNLKPLYDNVIVELYEKGTKFIDKNTYFIVAKVIEIGSFCFIENKYFMPLQVKVGDLVLVNCNTTHTIREKVSVIRACDIVSIVYMDKTE